MATKQETHLPIPLDELRIVYQPIVDLISERVIGYESLVRGPEGTPWESPDALFSTAASLGHIPELDWACMKHAVKGYSALGRTNPLFVNITLDTLMATDSESLMHFGRLATYQPRFLIVLEVSERGSVSGNRLAIERLALAKSRGMHLAVDDFGTGYSGLLAFTTLRPDYIKVDRSFVALLDGNPSARAVIRALVAMAGDSGCRLVAEGVETAVERAELMRLGVGLAQGYLLGRPGPLAAGGF